MERSRNSEPGEASSSVNDNGTRRQYYLKVTELPPQISEQELRHYFQDPKQFTGKPIERLDWNPQTQMAVIFFSDPDDVLRAVKQSPLVMNGKRICVEMGSVLRQEEPQEEVRTVKVKGLQEDDIELSLLYFENPNKGGGEIKEHRWDEEKKTLYITFTDAKVAEHLTNSRPSISGKTLDVALHNPQSEEDNSDHCGQCTVEVRGFDPSKVQVYEMYFQNPNKGGGDIANLVVNEDNTVMYVTFQTHEVAERVAVRSHTVSGLELRVKLAPQTSTVMITNCDVEKEELYKAYFENPKYGGGDIKETSVDRALQIMYITFEDLKVAQQVAKSSHRISGLELQVRLAPQTSTVMVTNCDVENEDLCKMYFENPKYGGGDIQEIIVDKELRAIYITFEDPEVAAAVCARRHTMKGQELEVKLHRIKPSGQKLKVSSAPEEKEETTLTSTIEVTVGNQLQSDETYLYYFENKRFGGGEIKKLESDKEKGLIHVTFVHHEVAEQIVNRQHTINGQAVDVKLYIPAKPRPTYKNRLLMENVKETNEDSLLLFIEYVTGCETAEVVYGEMPGVVLASFNKELDFTKAEEKCRVRTLAGNRVSVSKVPISNCLLVENLNPVTTEDTLSMYFENTKRSLGGPVERVEMVTGENKCLIYFADHTVIDGVLTKTHTIDHSTLTLKHYFECLGPSGGSLDGNTFILPKPLEMKDIDPCKTAFVSQSSKAQNDFMHLLSRCHGVPKFTENSVTVECTLKPSDSNALTLAKTWPQDVLQAVNKCLDQLDVHRLEILPENWLEVEKSVNSISLENNDDVICFVQPQDRVVVVAGFKSIAKNVFQQVSRTVKIIENEVNRKSKEIKETKSVKSFQLRLLDVASFQTEAEKNHNDVKVEICLQKGEITFQGMLKDVKEAQLAMFNILKSIKSDTITEMSILQEDLLDTKETCEFIVDTLKSEKITAVWEHVQNDVIVYAFNDADLEKAVHIIRTSVVHHIHPLTTESTQLLQSKDWLTLEQTLLDAHAGKLKIIPSLDVKQIVITGTSDILNGVLQEVQQFMQDNAVYTEVYSFSPSRQKFIVLYWKDKILSLANTQKAYKVQVTIDKDGEWICVRSTEKGLQMAKTKLKELGEKVLCHVETVTEPTKVKFLSSDSCAKELDNTEHICRCVVGFKEECTDLQVVHSSGQKGRNAVAAVSSVKKTVQSVQLAKSDIYTSHNTVDIIPQPTNDHSNISISILAGEIAKQKADVIVNSSSNGLDLSIGAVSGSILAAAGSGLQDECKAKYPNGIQIGEIARTSAYRLDCKEVFHIALCNFNNPKAQQELYDLVSACLTKASNSGYTSIAFPALGTGVLGFPRDVVARNFLGAIHSFQESTPATTLREVKVVVFKDTETIQEFKAGISNLGMSSATKSASIKRTPTQRATRKFETSSEQSVQAGAVEFEIFGLRLFVKQGDITEEKVDAIVNSTNAILDLNRGAVASALRTKCGVQLVNECKENVSEIKATGVTKTKAYTLKCKSIIHVDGDRFQSQWEAGIVAVLNEAEKIGARTLAIPALGTGAYGRSPSDCAKDMFRALTNLFSGQRGLLQELHVVLFDRSMIPPFISTFQSLGEKQKDNKSGFKGYAAEVKTSTLYVYGASEGNIKAFLAAFGELVNDTFISKEISDEALSWIGEDQIMEFKRGAKQFDVDIQIHPLACRLVMVGLRSNVFELTQKIFQSLRQEHRTKQEDKTASVLVNMVQWCFIEVNKTGTELREYGGRENHKIETAYQNKEKTVEIKDVDGNVYVIDFDLMKEYPKYNPSDHVDVTRKDKIKAGIDGSDIPKYWTPLNPGEHVKLVQLQPRDSEYQIVEKNFRSTLGPDGSNLKITVIERVQNPILYRQYQAKKAQLEKQNPGIQNEKILWHGTSVEALSNINNYGFNRSYCGKNATVYGEGVYFAVNSRYSASPTYSPPDPNTGKRYIYLCMVLTGYATKGDDTLRFLPPRSGPILFDSATDNNNSPIMFVIFNDTQAYPGYLITFQ